MSELQMPDISVKHVGGALYETRLHTQPMYTTMYKSFPWATIQELESGTQLLYIPLDGGLILWHELLNQLNEGVVHFDKVCIYDLPGKQGTIWRSVEGAQNIFKEVE